MAYDFTARTLTTTAFKAGFNFAKRGGEADDLVITAAGRMALRHHNIAGQPTRLQA